MRFRLLLTAAACAALIAAACGDGDNGNDDGAPGAGDDGTASASATADNSTPTPTVERTLTAPPTAAADGPAIQVQGNGETYAPTLAQLSALTQGTIDAGGTRTGATLSAIAAEVGFSGAGTATIEGRVGDSLGRGGFIRLSVADAGETTVLVPGSDGRVALYSTALPAEQWLGAVLTITIAP